jgi:hypothetical protein
MMTGNLSYYTCDIETRTAPATLETPNRSHPYNISLIPITLQFRDNTKPLLTKTTRSCPNSEENMHSGINKTDQTKRSLPPASKSILAYQKLASRGLPATRITHPPSGSNGCRGKWGHQLAWQHPLPPLNPLLDHVPDAIPVIPRTPTRTRSTRPTNGRVSTRKGEEGGYMRRSPYPPSTQAVWRTPA